MNKLLNRLIQPLLWPARLHFYQDKQRKVAAIRERNVAEARCDNFILNHSTANKATPFLLTLFDATDHRLQAVFPVCCKHSATTRGWGCDAAETPFYQKPWLPPATNTLHVCWRSQLTLLIPQKRELGKLCPIFFMYCLLSFQDHFSSQSFPDSKEFQVTISRLEERTSKQEGNWSINILHKTQHCTFQVPTTNVI